VVREKIEKKVWKLRDKKEYRQKRCRMLRKRKDKLEGDFG